jgi:hypothetical protein
VLDEAEYDIDLDAGSRRVDQHEIVKEAELVDRVPQNPPERDQLFDANGREGQVNRPFRRRMEVAKLSSVDKGLGRTGGRRVGEIEGAALRCRESAPAAPHTGDSQAPLDEPV